jgi:hypothetical protein
MKQELHENLTQWRTSDLELLEAARDFLHLSIVNAVDRELRRREIHNGWPTSNELGRLEDEWQAKHAPWRAC